MAVTPLKIILTVKDSRVSGHPCGLVLNYILSPTVKQCRYSCNTSRSHPEFQQGVLENSAWTSQLHTLFFFFQDKILMGGINIWIYFYPHLIIFFAIIFLTCRPDSKFLQKALPSSAMHALRVCLCVCSPKTECNICYESAVHSMRSQWFAVAAFQSSLSWPKSQFLFSFVWSGTNIS